MRRICFLFLAVACFMASSAQGQDLGVYGVSPEARNALLAMGAYVDHGRVDGRLVAELTPAQAEALRRQGYEVKLLFPSVAAREKAIRERPEFDQFHTYDQIRSDFYAYAAAHPDIAQLVVFGHSVQNRELFGLKITRQPTQPADRPVLVFWGGIHGDEYGGGEMPYRYALYLCDGYGVDPTVTRMVDDDEIWCIPMINPDGRANGTRTNANGIDLNRDLGYEWSGEGASPSPFSQVETRALREFCLDRNIPLSTTFHCSGDDVFYPWGYAPQNVPDHDIVVDVASAYASAASYFCGNSWQDYETHGEVLDDVYGSHGGICLTVEVSNSPTLVAQTFARNQAGLNLLCGLAGQGLHGVVTDAATGAPLSAAVWISGDPIPAYTDSQTGAMHRSVPPGTYTVTAWASGTVPQSVGNIVVPGDGTGEFQIALVSGALECAYRVTSVDQRDPDDVHKNVSFPSAALGAPDGVSCSLGTSGFIVLDMGAGHEIQDRPGADFEVVEADPPSDPGPEAYRVYAGDAYSQTTFIGAAVGTARFDLATAGLTSVRYLKIVDASGAPPDSPVAGMDLDAVIGNINSNPAGILTLATEPAASTLAVRVFPNPFRLDTDLELTRVAAAPGAALQKTSGPAILSVFDAAGRQIGPPRACPIVGAGAQRIRLDATGWPAGPYYFRIDAGGERTSGKLLKTR